MAENNPVEEEVEDAPESAELKLHSTGEMLRDAREQKDMSLEDVAKATRVPIRHLESIERNDFDALPGRTYAIGFAKSYARQVGVSETTIASQLREEMEEEGHGAYRSETSDYDPPNPTSVPPKALAWGAAGFAVLLLVGYIVWRTLFLGPTDLGDVVQLEANEEQPDAASDESVATAGTAADAAPTPVGGPVVLTATETVWMKVYDEVGERLFEDQMEAGESFTVPADANGPQILTGRPDALTVTVGGQVVPPLGTGDRTIADVPISADALLARAGGGSAPDEQIGADEEG